MDSDFWDQRYREKKLVWSAGPNQFLVSEVGELAPGRAIDIACGEGRNALWLAEQGWQVTGTDYSAVAIDKAKARATELDLDIDFHVADAAAPHQKTFDLILFFYLHIPRDEKRRSLEEARLALAPGGTLLYVGHDIRNIKEGIGGPQDSAILYGPEEISAMLSGLEIERAETVTRAVMKEGEQHTALDVLVRARKA